MTQHEDPAKGCRTGTSTPPEVGAGHTGQPVTHSDAAAASEELFAKAFRVSPAALWISEVDTGIALDVNDSFLRITGHTCEEVIGQTTMSLGLWADTGARQRLVEALLAGKKVQDLEIQFSRKSGEVREGLISAETVEIDGKLCLLVSCSDITERKRSAEELGRYADRISALLTEVSAGREALQSLSRRLLEIQESERRYIARELHDEIGQTLTAIQINIETLERLPEAKDLQPRLKESVSLVEQALYQIRNLSLDLRPSILDDLGLVSALLWYTERHAERTGLDIQIALDPLPYRLPTDIETTCFRVVQEALTNIARHSRARCAKVELCRRDGNIEAIVSDDGDGFDVKAAQARASAGASMGLIGMRERAELAGGRLAIDSVPGKGTTIKLLLPLNLVATVDPADAVSSLPGNSASSATSTARGAQATPHATTTEELGGRGQSS
ncbi:MAG: PAS domain-containing sensor histidine kinase [Chloroflexota bacterium]